MTFSNHTRISPRGVATVALRLVDYTLCGHAHPIHVFIHSFIPLLEFEFHSMHWNRNIAKRRLTIDDTIQIEKNVPPLLARRVELNLSNTSTILLVEINGNTVHMAATIVECISRGYWKRWPVSNPSLVCFGKW
jgi:hypothetical protein